MLLILSFAVGAIHVLAPDHWIPTSVFAWQRRWNLFILAPFAAGALLLHTISGAAVYFLLRAQIERLDSTTLFAFTMGWLGLAATVRAIRFSSAQNAIYSNSQPLWGILSLLGLLGPAESLLPILFRASHLGGGFALPIACYLAGTWACGILLMAGGRFLWDRPLWFSRSAELAGRKLAAFPVATGLAVGYALLR